MLNLTKGQKLDLTKQAGRTLTKITLGLGWDVARGAASIDLDASCATFAADKTKLEEIYFGRKSGHGGSIQHGGDNLTGDGDGDDETIEVDLTKLPANVNAVVFTVSSYRGQTFGTVENAYVRLFDDPRNPDKSEICRYELSAKGNHTGLIMAKLYRHNGAWKLAAIGETANGTTLRQLLPAIQPHL
jgi:tellurium resistance protein TerZ